MKRLMGNRHPCSFVAMSSARSVLNRDLKAQASSFYHKFDIMENLPSEIKLAILEQADFSSLRALVHASPSYHALYRSYRLRILTSCTLHHLQEKNFNLGPPSTWLKIAGRDADGVPTFKVPNCRFITVCQAKKAPSFEVTSMCLQAP